MTAPRKPTSVEVWKAIDDTAFKDEVDRVAAMSDQELEAELLKDGSIRRTSNRRRAKRPNRPRASPPPCDAFLSGAPRRGSSLPPSHLRSLVWRQ